MKYQEDFILDKKYLNLIDSQIYNTETDKFGLITGIEITRSGIQLRVYYDKMNSDMIAFFEDFEKLKLKFVIIKDAGFLKSAMEKYEKETKEVIKLFYGDKFSEDMIVYVEEEKRKEKNKENDQKEIKSINGTFMNLSKLSAEIFYDNYMTVELYNKYTNGDLTESELFYGICNYLCEEVKRLKDWNLELSMREFLKKETKFLIDYAKSRSGMQDEMIKDEDKEEMFKFMDMMFGKEDAEESDND